MKVYQNILETIGNTPLVRLQKVENEFNLKTQIYAKLESFNPTNSVKVRPAYFMLKDLMEKDLMDAKTTVIEATSGNTGIGLAMICAYLGNPCILVMPDSLSKERIDYMKLYGAEIVLTPGSVGINGAKQKALDINKEIENSVIPSQFSNQMNPFAHHETTAKEIIEALNGEIDYLFAGVGTGGTITGINKYFKENEVLAKMIAIEPENSSVISGNLPGKHKIQGIGAGFIPEILETDGIDEILLVNDDVAYEFTKLLPRLEGISIGISSGAVLGAAVDYIKKNNIMNEKVVLIFPDAGEKYFSTGVFN